MIINLSGPDGNAFYIMGVVKQILQKTGKKDQIPTYLEEAMSGDYDHLLEVSKRYAPGLKFR